MRRRPPNNISTADADHDADTDSDREVETLLKRASTINTSNQRPWFHQLRTSISTSTRTPSRPSMAGSPRGSSPHKEHNIRPSRRASIHPLEDFTLYYHASLIAHQSRTLMALLVHGTPIWLVKFVRLLWFVVALIPAFAVTVLFYFVTSDRVALPYISHDDPKRTSRHYLDIYGSTTTTTTTTTGKPVVLFLTGGAWIIGYKAWGTLLARTLVPFGILVVIPDYRNFPQTDVQGMVDDADHAVEWTLQHIAEYGGDPTKVVLAGQSAGAQLGACLLLKKAQLEAPTGTDNERNTSTNNTTSWHALDIKGFIATSGPYDLVAMRDILHTHGLDKSIVSAMFCNDVARYSPTLTVRDLLSGDKDQDRQRVQLHFPPTCVIHGQVDKTVPFQISVDFYEALKQLQQSQPPPQQQSQSQQYLEFKLYPSWSHTDPILEAPFAGNHLFHRDVYDLAKLWTTTEEEEDLLLPFDESHSACWKICPLFLVQIARFCNPF